MLKVKTFQKLNLWKILGFGQINFQVKGPNPPPPLKPTTDHYILGFFINLQNNNNNNNN